MRTLLTTLLLISAYSVQAQIIIWNYEYEDVSSREMELIDQSGLNEKATWFFSEDGKQLRCLLKNVSEGKEDDILAWNIIKATQFTEEYIEFDVLTNKGEPYTILVNLEEEHVFIDNKLDLKASLMTGNVDVSLIIQE